MVLRNEVPDLGKQLDLVGDGESVLHVTAQDETGHARSQVVVLVAGVDLVLDVVFGCLELADVVVVGTHSNQEIVGSDGFGSRFGQGADGDAVVIRSRGFQGQTPQDGVVQIRELKQANVGGDPEKGLQYREQQGSQHGGQDPTQESAG